VLKRQALQKDWELMLQLASGDSAAITGSTEFSRLFERYHGLIFRTAYRLTGNAADAEDVLQTIFLRLLRQQALTSADHEESYFRRAAVNAALDILRARKPDRNLTLEDPPVDDAVLRSHEMRESLRRAFTVLSPRSAEIFALRHLEDLSNREIAQELGISQILVAVTLHRARRQLQKEIRSYFGETA
jgi:RNA polymerase sigma-70 factor (ECF subfamily)